MSKQTCNVAVRNDSGATARIVLWHQNSTYGTQHESWTLNAGETSTNLTVPFPTGFLHAGVLDYWAVEMIVLDGPNKGAYASTGVLEVSQWKECQLQKKDAGTSIVFPVSTTKLDLPLPSGGCSTPMNKVALVSADVSVTNATDGHATITLYHNNESNGTQSASWQAAPGETVGPLTTPFRVGFDAAFIRDWWAIEVAVADGTSAGTYQSSGFASLTDWKECQLQKADAGKNLTFTVDTSTFDINLDSGGCSTSMGKVGPYTEIGHVFVLMLENHSFDNVFGFSGIPGVNGVSSSDSNTYKGKTYAVGNPGAPSAMPTDPGHEFTDVYEQLIGEGETHAYGTPYPDTITNSGFVANYATTTTEQTKNNPNLPTPGEIGEVMECFDTPKQLPVMLQLATEFAICDQWFSSIPGPTWPNRFFVHGASSAGWTESPSSTTIAKWMTVDGFAYPSGSVFDRITDAGAKWRIYVDEDGPIAGGVPQVASLKGIKYKIDTNAFGSFADDVQGPYPYAYTFIEPNYGDVTGGSYVGGSSQHPMDSMERGEELIKETYEALRASPLWDRSVLIVTYDEHGGFYDSGQPGKATPPADGSDLKDKEINPTGFLFDHYGVRVPAMVVSPLIPKGTVDHTVYDHSSVPATLARNLGFDHLTKRDAAANDIQHLLSLATPRTDCPETLVAVNPAGDTFNAVTEEVPLASKAPLHVLAKTDIELRGGDDAARERVARRVAQIKTNHDAEDYAADVAARAELRAMQGSKAPTRHTMRGADAFPAGTGIDDGPLVDLTDSPVGEVIDGVIDLTRSALSKFSKLVRRSRS